MLISVYEILFLVATVIFGLTLVYIYKKKMKILKLNEKCYRIICEQSDSAIFEFNYTDNTFKVSKKFKDIFGWEPTIKDLPKYLIKFGIIFRDDIDIFKDACKKATIKDEKISIELRVKNSNDQYIWCLVRAFVVYNGYNRPYKVIGKITNIDNQKRETLTLIQKTQNDCMTMLYNKCTTQDLIDSFLSNEGKEGIHAVMIIDIDNLKYINDNFGHATGDFVIQEFAKKIKNTFYPSDIIGRVGGDEFILFLKNFENEQHIYKNAQKISDIFKTIIIEYNINYKVTSSIGISVYNEHGHTYDELYKKADTALYESKNNGKNTYVIYDTNMEYNKCL